MGTTSEKLTYLNDTKTQIKAAIEAKGVTVGNVPFRDYVSKIGDISGSSLQIVAPIEGEDVSPNFNIDFKLEADNFIVKIDGSQVDAINLRSAVSSLPEGSHTVTVEAYDGTTLKGTQTRNITVVVSNTAPTANSDSYSVIQNNILSITAVNGVLSNDTDSEGDSLTAELMTSPVNGSITFNADGSFDYTPSTDYTGADSFTYRTFDGKVYSANATVTITVISSTDWVSQVLTDYEARVTADYGSLEDSASLQTDLINIGQTDYNDAILIYNPNGGYKTGKAYDVRDTDNTSPNDLTVSGGGGTRKLADGTIEDISNESKNYILWSFDLTQSWWENYNGATVALSETGINGEANKATLITDSNTGNYPQIRKTITISAGEQVSVVQQIWFKKDQDESRYPEFYCGGNYNEGGSDYATIQVNTKTGASAYRGTPFGTHEILDEGAWWVINMKLTPPVGYSWATIYINIRAAMGDGATTLGSGFSSAITGSLIIGNVDARISESYIDKPIINNGNLANGYIKVDYTTGRAAFEIEPERINYLLNSATLQTQDVTVSAESYALSFKGAGSISLSGAYSGTLTGTSASDRVELIFTPTAGTLTLTISGTVEVAQLEKGNYSTTPIINNSSIKTRPYLEMKSSSVLGIPSSFCAYIEFYNKPIATTRLFGIGEGNDYSANAFRFTKGSDGKLKFVVKDVNGNGTGYIDTGAVLNLNATNKVLIRYTEGTTWELFVNGTKFNLSAFVNITPGTFDTVSFGSDRFYEAFNTMYNFMVLPTRTDQEAINLTTL